MRIFAIVLLLFLPSIGKAQLTSTQQKSLNAYADYANHSGEEVSRIVSSVIEYHSRLDNKTHRPNYVCPFQLTEYYLTQVSTLSKSLPVASSASIVGAFNELRAAEKKVDQKCKALDTYHKLEDFKRDNYEGAKTMIREMIPLLSDYRKKHASLQKALETASKPLDNSPLKAYRQTDRLMLAIIEKERAFLNQWVFNLNEKQHAGWPFEKLQPGIAESVSLLKNYKASKPELKYPASSMWSHFDEVYTDYIEVKRNALDQNTFEAKKTDEYSNEVYLNLINYFNGTLVSDYNTFLGFSEGAGYLGIKTLKYVTGYDSKETSVTESVDIKPFNDILHIAPNITAQKTAIPRAVFNALNEYIEFTNETYRQTQHLMATFDNVNPTAARLKGLKNYEHKSPLVYALKDFQIPLSYQQKVTLASKSLNPQHAKTLNDQVQVIMNMMKEMEAQAAALDAETDDKKYEQDSLKKVYEILERQEVLFKTWDDYKEQLYKDVRAIYDSYAATSPSSSWWISGKALRDLADLDHDGVFLAKAYFGGDSSVTISTEKIDAKLRDVISNEYENMKGIQKIGRANGNCPYTPYEDLPESSRLLSERLNLIHAPKKKSYSRYDDPYYRIIYIYNNIVDYNNKFSELSTTVPHLKSVFQPERYQVKYPEKKVEPQPEIASNSAEEKNESQNDQQEKNIATTTPSATQSQQSSSQASSSVVQTQSTSHSTDTVYIEKRDTIYLREPLEKLRSMEGYATNNMVLLLDVSGSMNQPDKLPLLKESMLQMISMMREEDRISVVIFAAKPKILLKPTSFKDEAKIRKAVSDLSSSGKTDGNSAIKMAYKVADESYIRGGNNRIILATDGVFPIQDDVRELIDKFSKDDIFFSVFNFGKGMGASQALENLAKLGKGNYTAISEKNVEIQLINEAKAKRRK